MMVKNEKDDHVMTIKEFQACCEVGGFINSDGHGYLGYEKEHDYDFQIRPSQITGEGWVDYSDFTHVTWFNR